MDWRKPQRTGRLIANQPPGFFFPIVRATIEKLLDPTASTQEQNEAIKIERSAVVLQDRGLETSQGSNWSFSMTRKLKEIFFAFVELSQSKGTQ